MMQTLGGDWQAGKRAAFRVSFFGTPLWLHMPGKFPFERINFDQIAAIEQVTDANRTSIAGAAGWGAAGALLLGGAGLVAGALLGGKKQRHIVAVRFLDGRSVLLECPQKEFKWLLGIAHSRSAAARPK